jgi:hypothetical protein
MDIVGLIVVLAAVFTIVGVVVAVLDWLGFVPNGHRILAKIKGRVGARRRSRKQPEMEKTPRDLRDNVRHFWNRYKMDQGTDKATDKLLPDIVAVQNELRAKVKDAATLAQLQEHGRELNRKLDDIAHQGWENAQFEQRLKRLGDGLAQVRQKVRARKPAPILQTPLTGTGTPLIMNDSPGFLTIDDPNAAKDDK